MGFPGNDFHKLGAAGLLATFVLLSSNLAESQGLTLESAGVRYGFSARESTANFKQSEAFANWNLPWSWFLFTRWHLQMQLDCSAGWLGGNGEGAAIFTSGPSLMVRRDHVPLFMEFGTSPTIMSRDTFGSKDFGTLFQFTSYGGLDLHLGRHARFGYRYQHMSNAHLAGQNPGLNMHVLQASWQF
jgi:lipid A 3-O-deacylase PagL